MLCTLEGVVFFLLAVFLPAEPLALQRDARLSQVYASVIEVALYLRSRFLAMIPLLGVC